MFRHIVLYKLKGAPDDIARHAEEMKQRFDSMPSQISVIRSLECGIDTLRSARSFDISLVMTFDSKEDFLAYKAHPYHQNHVAAFVHSVIDASVSTDYDMG